MLLLAPKTGDTGYLFQKSSWPAILSLLGVWLLLGFLNPTTSAQDPPASPTKSGKQQVSIGIFVNKLEGISLTDNLVEIDFYLWFRFRDPSLRPHESFSLINGEVTNLSEVYSKEIDGGYYSSCRVQGVVHVQWNVSDFPLDNHQVAIQIESSDLDSGKLIFVPDLENSAINESAQAGGWVITPGQASVDEHSYNTNYGDPEISPTNRSLFSRFTYTIKLQRSGKSTFIKLFSGLVIAAAIAFLCFFISPNDVDPRFGLPVGAMFAAIASEFVVVSTLPDTPGLTMADELHIITFFFIFISLIESTISLWLWNHDRKTEAKRLDRICGYAVPLLFLLSWLVLIEWRCEGGLLGTRPPTPAERIESE